MNGGTISRGNAGGSGGGVHNEGTFIMNGGMITDNTSNMGGGVYNAGAFTMNGGMISGNRAINAHIGGGGGGGVRNSGTFTMNGGMISNNIGSGVQNRSAPAVDGTGMTDATFIMNGGMISDNITVGFGGGVWIASGATFTMRGGTISGNTAGFGGGVAIGLGTFTIEGGWIFDNTATGEDATLLFDTCPNSTADVGRDNRSFFNNRISDPSRGGIGVRPPSGAAPAVPAPPIRVTLNGENISFDQPPIMESGRTLVPLRAIFEALGAEVDWNGDTQTVTAVKDGVTVTLRIGSYDLIKSGHAPTQTSTLDVPPQLVGGRTMVPARAVAESFGATVDWCGDTRTVIITN